MSFKNPLKRHHAPKKSAISQTAEREFKKDVGKIEQLDENTKTIYKDMKMCTESQAALARCQSKMAQTLSNSSFAKEDESICDTAEQWAQATQKLEQIMQELNANSQKTVTEPMKRFGTIFPSVQTSVKRRGEKLQEYSKCQAKVDKLHEKERTGPIIVKLDSSKKALNAAKGEFDALNDVLKDELPLLYEGRIDYFKPSLDALVKSEVNYYRDAEKVYGELCNSLDCEKDDGYSQKMQQRLSDIKALSITSDD